VPAEGLQDDCVRVKKPAKPKKPANRKPSKAREQPAHQARHTARSQPTHPYASDIGPITALLLALPKPAPSHPVQRATARTSAVSARQPDNASDILLLSLPILALFVSLGITQTFKPLRRIELTAAPASWIVPSPPATPKTASSPPALQSLAATPPPAPLTGAHPSIVAPAPIAIDALPANPATALDESRLALVLPNKPALTDPTPTRTAMLSPQQPSNLEAGTVAPLIVVPLTLGTDTATQPPQLLAIPGPELVAYDATLDPGPSVCTAPAHILTRGGRPSLPSDPVNASLTPAAFGQSLAAAAQAQTKDFVIYNDKYRAISYPNGDVQPLYGVCTDVIIRAYRALGIDLQQLVHEARIGSGDPNIDHRRTEVLRRFFARFGEQRPASTYAEDFLPGDIVTYNRPQNRHSRSHIAMVSNTVGPSGRYMIVHNRGWGPQLEDGLFVDEITGHYRYRATPARPTAAIAGISRATQRMAVPAPQKRPDIVETETARDARIAALKRRDGAPVQGLGR